MNIEEKDLDELIKVDFLSENDSINKGLLKSLE